MSPWIHLIPLFIAFLVWWAFARVNRKIRWFRVGELIFWDAILLIIVYLIWLYWF